MTPRARRPADAASLLGQSLASASVVRLLAVPLVLAVPFVTSVSAAPPAAAASYTVARALAPSKALLAADDPAWSGGATISWGPAPYETRFRALWSQEGLYLRYDVDDPSPWHTMTQRDEHIWEEEAVEIFLDADRSGHDYYELEISPANVVCDLRMIDASPWKGDFHFDLAGLETRVIARTDGAGRTAGWTATALLPWSGLRALPSVAHVETPPRPGDRWRFNVFRIERPGGNANPEKDAVQVAWSKPTGDTFHDPSVFRDMVFLAGR
jgi:hypothetical protein